MPSELLARAIAPRRPPLRVLQGMPRAHTTLTPLLHRSTVFVQDLKLQTIQTVRQQGAGAVPLHRRPVDTSTYSIDRCTAASDEDATAAWEIVSDAHAPLHALGSTSRAPLYSDYSATPTVAP